MNNIYCEMTLRCPNCGYTSVRQIGQATDDTIAIGTGQVLYKCDSCKNNELRSDLKEEEKEIIANTQGMVERLESIVKERKI